MSDEEDFTKLRFQLLRANPFFGSLVHRVEMEYNNNLPFPTAATDGKTIMFDRKFMEKLTVQQQLSIFAHELLHVCFVHPWRMEKYKDEERLKANIAADFLINCVLKEMGFTMMPELLYNENYTPDKYTMESLMKLIKIEKMPQCQSDVHSPGSGSGKDKDKGGKKGGKDGKDLTPQQVDEMEEEMKGILKQAAAHARQAGKGSPSLERLIDMWNKPEINWKEVLHDFMRKKTKEDTSWVRPSRRGLPLDLYLPIKAGVKCGHIGVAIDLSGSIGDAETKLFTTELKFIFEMCKPTKVTVITFDDGIRDEFEFDEFPDKLRYRGGGGTDFRPVFKRFQELADQPADPLEALIFMTDLCGPFPDKHPTYPVFFLSTYKEGKAPFGEVCYSKELDRKSN
jgi:predicted metal-dependent peptidase